MTTKIDKKITGYKVLTEATPAPVAETPRELLHEGLKRPEHLMGSTYKIKTPAMESAMYITINDIVIDGKRHPYELFINSKDVDHFQWVTALTRVVSAIFRKSGNVTFLAEELQQVFDPKGGSWRKGKFVPSLVAEIGLVLEQHFQNIGLLAVEELTEVQKEIIAEKKAQYEEKHGVSEGIPASATLCTKCNTKAVILMDNCRVCLSCGDSKCN